MVHFGPVKYQIPYLLINNLLSKMMSKIDASAALFKFGPSVSPLFDALPPFFNAFHLAHPLISCQQWSKVNLELWNCLKYVDTWRMMSFTSMPLVGS